MRIGNAQPTLAKQPATPATGLTPAAVVASEPASADALHLSAHNDNDDDIPQAPQGKQSFKEWFTSVRRTEDRIYSSPLQKIAFGAVCASGAYAASHVIGGLVQSPSVGAAVGTAAVDVAGLAAGWLAGDVISGVMHHWSENYASPDEGPAVARKIAKQAHRHHYHPSGLGDYTLPAWAAPHSFITWAPLAAATALNAPGPLLAASITTVAATSCYGLFHMYSHYSKSREDEIPTAVKVLQKATLAMSRKEHAEHHAKPWNTDYCMVTGHMNRIFDKIDFWPKYEKAVFAVTGKEPDSWKVKDYKAFALGEISKEEYISRASSVSQDFKTEIFQARKPRWNVD